MKKISFTLNKAADFIPESEITALERQVLCSKDILLERKAPGSDYTGWIDLPIDYDKEEFGRIKKAAEKIQKEAEVLVVIGIGGSYLGARAAIDFIKGSMYNAVPASVRKTPEILFAGNCISTDYTKQLISVIGDRDFSVNVISKSGTTTEPAIAFRIFKDLLEKKYGKEEAAKRIYATTDKARGALKTMADAEGYETFVVPDDVGGRYSVLTAVGLLPIAVAGIDIDELMEGAVFARESYMKSGYDSNDALRYVAARHIMMRKGRFIEVLVNYEPSLHYISEWWKQLYGESEGKDLKSLFPASMDFTTDLHSMGQYLQDGQRIMFETILNVESSNETIVIDKADEDLDGLNYLAGKDMHFVNQNAMEGTILAHKDGGVASLMINLPDRSAYTLGQLFYFFEFACGVSGYLLGVNPFNQPGVESYKKNMFKLLGKPGF